MLPGGDSERGRNAIAAYERREVELKSQLNGERQRAIEIQRQLSEMSPRG